MKTIKETKITDIQIVGLMKGRNWYGGDGLTFVFNDFFIVGQWFDFHDGEKSNIEGKQTIAICQRQKDAESIYDNYINDVNGKQIDKLKELHKILKLNKTGYAGVMPNGNIVDRREHPDAMPVQKNRLLGIPTPKKLR